MLFSLDVTIVDHSNVTFITEGDSEEAVARQLGLIPHTPQYGKLCYRLPAGNFVIIRKLQEVGSAEDLRNAVNEIK